jgi:molybdopterin-guanine dinucleotide biosynthesis protein A
MGRDKALVEVCGQPLIQLVAHALGRAFPRLLVVTNDPAAYAFLGLEMVSDLLPGRGALGGLHAALFFSPTPHVFVVGCDMPFLSPALMGRLADGASRWDVVVPRVGHQFEPLHAVYARRCLKFVERALDAGGRRIFDFYAAVRVREVPEADLRALDPELRSFLNVNTPADLERIAALAAGTRDSP